MGNEIGRFLFEHVYNVYMQDADGPVLTIFSSMEPSAVIKLQGYRISG